VKREKGYSWGKGERVNGEQAPGRVRERETSKVGLS